MPKYEETYFDERSGIIPCKTPWGQWWQTVAEVHIEIDMAEGTRAKDVSVIMRPSSISVTVAGKKILEGPLFSVTVQDEMIWTLEDRRKLHIVLTKADASVAETVWEGLLKNNYLVDPWTIHEMRKKLDLERFQIENPGFDFSGAQLSKTYDKVPDSAVRQWEEKQQKL